MSTASYTVVGMTCGHCVNAVTEEVGAVPGVTALSAGVSPKPGIHPCAVSVVHERLGVDLSGQRPRSVESLAGRRFDRVITLCDRARENWHGLADHPHRSHWSIPDPAADPPEPSCGSNCGSGGGCGSGCGSCSRGAVKSADDLTAYFLGLRTQMEATHR